ncbi:MAG: heme ABC exporter ATP-binding protein CcmA [Rhodobacteraceae bacterium]|nr:heme ABC exporter ATP-binding protein CcmA [Paracoccaceae bacterium]
MMLRVKDLTVARGGLPVLAGVSFSVDAGQAVMLRGPNGSGKTTLLRTIARLQDPVAGQIECDPDQVAYAAHSDGLKSMLSARENLRFWADVYGGGDVEAALEAFELSRLAERMAAHLSAGQRRRLGLARLLVVKRPIWILDEPTVSLDEASVALFANGVKAHLATGGLALIATHLDLGFAAERFDVSAYRATAEAVGLGASDEAFL